MGKRIPSESTAVFQSIKEMARISGIPRDAIRRGVKSGTIPAIRIGEGNNAPYMIDTELFFAQMHKAAEQGANILSADKKACPGAAIPEAGGGTGSDKSTGSLLPIYNNITERPDRQEKVSQQPDSESRPTRTNSTTNVGGQREEEGRNG